MDNAGTLVQVENKWKFNCKWSSGFNMIIITYLDAVLDPFKQAGIAGIWVTTHTFLRSGAFNNLLTASKFSYNLSSSTQWLNYNPSILQYQVLHSWTSCYTSLHHVQITHRLAEEVQVPSVHLFTILHQLSWLHSRFQTGFEISITDYSWLMKIF